MLHTTTCRNVVLIVLLALLSASQPGTVAAGSNVWTSNGPEGGTIYALAIDPKTPTTLYAGTRGGGVFKSTSGGGTWSPVNTGLTSFYVHALAIDLATPSILYAGASGAGVFKSTNGGGNWSPVNTGLPAYPSSIGALAVAPSPLPALPPKPPVLEALPPYNETHTPQGAQVCGEITSDTTWTAATGVYTVTCDVSVVAGVTLTIEPGVAVKFEHTGDDLIVAGALQAAGTEAAPILFQPVTGGTRGSWGRVAFLTGSAGALEYAVLEYGGASEGLLYIASDQVQVLNSVVQYSACTGIVIQAASPLISATQSLSNAGYCAGGGIYNDSGSPTIQNNTFVGNSATGHLGGGIYNESGSPTIQNNTFVSNSATYGGGIYNVSGSPTIQHNTFDDNSVFFGGGIYNYFGSPTIQNNTFSNNSGGGIANGSGSPMIQNNTFGGNSTSQYGGGIYNGSGSPTIQNNSFSGNTTPFSGGGIYNESGSPAIQNNTFRGNLAKDGGGIYNNSGRPIIRNNTIASNSASNLGGGIYNNSGRPAIRNNVIVSNSASSRGGGIYIEWAGPALSMDYNNLWNNTDGNYVGIAAGPHDISTDPLFVDAATDDFHLRADSPCIDAGDPYNPPATDYEGDSRPMGLGVDIGADEFRGFGVSKMGLSSTTLGETITYRLGVVNMAATAASSVVFTDTLPLEVRYVSHQSVGLSCAYDGVTWGGRLTCTVVGDALAVGESRPLTLTVAVTTTLPAPLIVVNQVAATASMSGELAQAQARAETEVTWCRARLNDGLIGNDIQAAVNASESPDDVIKVSGTCYQTLTLDKTLTLQGGWNHDFSLRDPRIYTTTVDAQWRGSVLRINGAISPTIDGFFIIHGYAYYGGGIDNVSGSPTIQNNSFSDNSASKSSRSSFGGGIYNGSGSPIIRNNTFSGNSASYSGGGIFNGSGNPSIQNNIFNANVVSGISHSGGIGGGISNESGSPDIRNNTFNGNSALGMGGGGIHNSANGNPRIEGNTFSNNTAPDVFRNGFSDGGGGIYNRGGAPVIQNNTFSGNRAAHNGPTGGGGAILTYGSPTIQNNTFTDNVASNGPGGGISSSSGSPIIQNNIFSGNKSQSGVLSHGGGAISTQYGNPIIQNNILNMNLAYSAGGGIRNDSGNPTIQNNTFRANSASYGGGIYSGSGSPVIRSNIIVNNQAHFEGAGIYVKEAGPDLDVDYNNLWRNYNSNYKGVTPGTHDISADPRLVNVAAGDFHLLTDSPCIDAGDPDHYPATDFEGDSRPLGLAPDIGADEVRPG